MRNAVDTGLVYGSSARPLLETDDLLEPVEKALLDVLRLAADPAQLTERLLLFLSQVGRDDDSHVDNLVAAPTRTQVWNPAPVDAKQLAVLGSGRDLDPFRPINCGNLDRVAQGGLDDMPEDRLDRTAHLPRASPQGTGLGRRARLRAGTLARLARLGPGDGQLALDPADSFFESEPQVEPQVSATARPGAGSPR